MSKHIKKQVIATGAVAGLGALVGTASADTIVYANGDKVQKTTTCKPLSLVTRTKRSTLNTITMLHNYKANIHS